MANFNTGFNYYNPATGLYNYQIPQQTYIPTNVPAQIQPAFQPIYVHGLDGANAYQLQPGVTRQILWDDEQNRFYIKGLDEYGRPKILADNDFTPHVEAQTESHNNDNVDFSVYPTKKDMEEFLSKFDVSRYLTKADLDKALSELSLGAQGRIVRNEHDA